LNHLLRIGYNFASDAIILIQLLVSISDLKPIVNWLTIDAHIELASAFRQLPWKKSKKKASLSYYRELINSSRNHAFHNLFSLQSSISINLDGIALNAEELRIFSPFTKKEKNSLKYQDQEIVDIFTKFTRAPRSTVAIDFLEKNLVVINKTKEYVDSFSGALRALI
jgi:hypothetical protein